MIIQFLGWYVKDKTAEYSASGRRSRKASKECRISVNERKGKDLRISFARNEPVFHPLCVNNGPQTLETVNCEIARTYY